MSFDLKNIDLQAINDLDIREAGRWPVAGQAVLIAIVFAIIVGAGYWLLIRDQYATLSQVQKKEITLKQTFKTKQAKAANLEALRAQLANVQADFGELLRQLPSKTEIPSLLRDISQTAKVDGLQQELFQPRKEVEKGFYAEKPIEMIVTGPYHKLARFVSDVAALPRIVTLHNIQIEPVKKEPGKLSMKLTAKTYRYLQKKGG